MQSVMITMRTFYFWGLTKQIVRVNLTIFNMFASQGTPQMAVDNDAISLSRVDSYKSKCNLPLFYVQGDIIVTFGCFECTLAQTIRQLYRSLHI